MASPYRRAYDDAWEQRGQPNQEALARPALMVLMAQACPAASRCTGSANAPGSSKVSLFNVLIWTLTATGSDNCANPLALLHRFFFLFSVPRMPDVRVPLIPAPGREMISEMMVFLQWEGSRGCV